MHLLSAQAGAIQLEGEAIDLDQTPGAYVFASSADSELAMLAGAADRAGQTGLRLASTLRLSHNYSVDLWLEKTVSHARLVVLRLIGGAAYWQYGVDELTGLAMARGIKLVLLPGDANPDPILQARSSIPPEDWSRLHALFTAGGPDNADAIVQAFAALAEGRGLADVAPKPFARFGVWYPGLGMVEEEGLRQHLARLPTPSPTLSARGRVLSGGFGEIVSHAPAATLPLAGRAGEGESPTRKARPFAPILFYRAALEGAGTATLEALISALEAAGLAPVPLVVSSLKEGACIRFVQAVFAAFPPDVILNLTGFALGLDGLDDKANPFAGTDAPVIQLVQGGRPKAQWQADPQGLSSKDLAMQVVLPELDGRIGDILIGHKDDAVWHAGTQCPLSSYAPDAGGIARAVSLAANWVRLRLTPAAERRVALVLANYPIRDGRLANGVGYDAPASTVELLKLMAGAGYNLATPTPNPSPQGGGEATPMAFSNGRKVQGKSIDKARALRADQTVPERVLWPLLKTFGKRGVHFRRQVPIGAYIADFASHHPKLVIELDGETHAGDVAAAHDRARTTFLESVGYRVLRFTNSDVALKQDGIWQTISAALDELAAPSLPSPLRGGAGGGGRDFDHTITPADLITLLQSGPTNAMPSRGQSKAILPLARYAELFEAALPEVAREAITARWGEPSADPFAREDGFHLPLIRFGNVVVLLQPARGYDRDETLNFHDPALVPPHAYCAAYLWLRHEFSAHALVHNGKHGNLEWLPGKANALDDASYPAALWGGLPHLYPFIVHDPGEGTQAKRRTGAVIIDHLTPPLTRAETYGPLKDLEALLDEYYAASGMDRRRLADLKRRILDFTRDAGLDRDIALPENDDAALVEIDNFLCELKEAQIRDGLHIFGQSPTGVMERDLAIAMVRVPRGEASGADASLIRALADDLKLGFDPLTARLGNPWQGPKPDELTTLLPDAWRTTGDTVERLEALAAALFHDRAPDPSWTAVNSVMTTVKNLVRPRIAASGPAEQQAFLRGLEGKFITPGASGAPSRGRIDVLPTGRNFYSVDNRAVPTPVAWELGRKSAENLLLRHMQDHGDYLRSLALSVWGTANMRTGGDDIAQALAFIGAKPTWDPSSLRVSGYEIIPLARLGRPRVDVTLRISGFFRDAFPAQIALFDRAVRAIGALDEPEDQNPIAARMRSDALGLMKAGASEAEAGMKAGYRVFGSKPGAYGAGLQALIDSGQWTQKSELADAFVDWGQYAYGAQTAGTPERDWFVTRLKSVEAVVQNQDNREHDLLDSDDYYQFEGGLAASVEMLRGERPAAYHNDHSRPERPLVRTLEEEISRVMRSRVVNPKWIAGVMRHGYKGAFEIIATVDFMFAFAATTGAVKTHHFDLAFDAFVENEAVRQFLIASNRFGYDELIAKFDEAIRRGLWTPRSNSAYGFLAGGKHE